jgi:hypothetical protein
MLVVVMPDFSKGKIYKIVGGGNVYYGSTVLTLKQRLSSHKTCGRFKEDFYVIELVENYPCLSRKALLEREQYYIENNECINKKRAFLPDDIRKSTSTERAKGWYSNNRERAITNVREYYNTNKDTILEKAKEKRVCECGALVRKHGLHRHLRTEKHKSYVNIINPDKK